MKIKSKERDATDFIVVDSFSYLLTFKTKQIARENLVELLFRNNIIKAHGREIKVETREGEFTEFVILLPTST